MKTQNRLPLAQEISKEEAEKIVHQFIREQYGTIPSPGEPKLEEGIWKFPINANYPRILFNEYKKKPEKIRFMTFKNIGEIHLSNEGDIISHPRYFTIRGVIKLKLDEIRTSVEKALVKVGANKFSQLTFPDHMFTPIQDILSWLLIEDTINIHDFLSNVVGDKKERYLQNIELLKSVSIIKQEGTLIIPGDSFVEIEMDTKLSNPQKLAASLALFYERGYENIDAIRSFLGPHLILSGFCYEESIECDSMIAIRETEFRKVISENYYDTSKLIKLPRYLLQLENIGVIQQSKKIDEISWEPNPELYEKLRGEEDLMAPIQEMIISSGY